MNIRKYRGATITGGIGTLIIAAHIILAITLGLTASQWMSGAGIGIVLVFGSVLHVVMTSRRRKSVKE